MANCDSHTDGQMAVLQITELEPKRNGAFCGKRINPDGSLTEYPLSKFWWQSVAQVPATIPQLCAYLCEARQRNVCLIRGTPANPDRQPTLRQKAGVYGTEDRGDHGFYDEPTKLFPLDIDGIKINWRADPKGAVQDVVAQLGEPWASTSFVWFFSTKHGLEIEKMTCPTTGKKHKRWTGKIIDGLMYVRIVFITEHPISEQEAIALTSIASTRGLKLDRSICRTIQPNYIRRPYWVEHPDHDVLGDIPTIGWVEGAHDTLTIPDNLAHTARWAKA